MGCAGIFSWFSLVCNRILPGFISFLPLFSSTLPPLHGLGSGRAGSGFWVWMLIGNLLQLSSLACGCREPLRAVVSIEIRRESLKKIITKSKRRRRVRTAFKSGYLPCMGHFCPVFRPLGLLWGPHGPRQSNRNGKECQKKDRAYRTISLPLYHQEEVQHT